MALQQKALNRYLSLKQHFGDRYFTAQQAREFLGLTKTTGIYDLLNGLLNNDMVTKCTPLKKPAEFKIVINGGARPATLADVAEVSQQLQAELRIAPQAVALGAKKAAPVVSALPATITIDGVKYIRADRLAEVVLDLL